MEGGLIVGISLGRVILAYKNFAASRNISHIGLGVAALNTAKTLRASGIAAEVWPIVNAADLRTRLDSDGLRFKIRVLGSNVRAGDGAAGETL